MNTKFNPPTHRAHVVVYPDGSWEVWCDHTQQRRYPYACGKARSFKAGLRRARKVANFAVVGDLGGEAYVEVVEGPDVTLAQTSLGS